MSISDKVPLNKYIVGGKICMLMFYQFKGNKRDLVIIYNINAGYFKFLGCNLPDN